MSIELMKQMVDELEYVLDCINQDKIPFDGDDFHEILRLGRQAIAEAEKQEPVAVIVEKTDSGRITGADFGVGCSDGGFKYTYKTAQFYPTGEKTITNFDVTWNEVLEAGTLLYTHPQPKAEKERSSVKQEPVAWICIGVNDTHDIDFDEDDVNALPVGTMLYTHPQPKRRPSDYEWVGLTDEDELDWEEGGNLKDLVKAIEAKLKEKNHG